MKKLLVLGLALILSTSSCFAWGFKKKQDAKQTLNTENIEVGQSGKGYIGTLPDISKSFGASEPKTAKPVVENSKLFNSSDEIKPVPRDNPAFVNIILKEDKTSPYLNDIKDLLPILENILTCIENGYDVQKFNAKVYFLNKNIDYLCTKYEDKPEYNFVSFQKIMGLRTYTQSVANLRAEAEKYRPYLAYTGAGYLYNDTVIDQQLEYLKTEIEDTIVVIKEAR